MKIKLLLKGLAGLMILLFANQTNGYSQNLLDLSGWTVGTGTAGVFTMSGIASENTREWGIGPDNKGAILWKGIPSGSQNGDGGWTTQTFPIIHTNMYRYTIWLKKTNSSNGVTYFGCGALLNLAGAAASNPYFFNGDLPALDKWYLLVGYIHASDDGSVTNYGGVYDGATGAKVQSTTDYKFVSGAVNNLHRTFLYNDAELNDRLYFYAPRVDLVNGNEPSIA